MHDPLKSKYLAYVLSATSRAELLAAYPPKHEKVVAHHVTIQFNVTEAGMKLLDSEKTPEVVVVAYASDDKVDCVLVNFKGTCKRMDGSFFHVTLSTSAIGKPVDSNALLKAQTGLDWNKTRLVLSGKLELVNK